MEQKPAAYYGAAAERARRLRADATTRRLKEHLAAEIARYESIAEEIQRASERGAEEEAALTNETPGPNPLIRGSEIPLGRPKRLSGRAS
jgi:hypothetical protein